jgi:mannose-1-phosphate guanylyltransferase
MKRAAVIMAGGSGTRLWPLSRKARPKQLLRILDGKSLLFRAYERLSAVLPDEDIHVIALADHLREIAVELPMLPPQNLIGEPTGRDTAAAVAISAAILHEKDPATQMGIFTADHLIRPVDKFAATIRRGFDTLDKLPDSLITFGIKPTEPHTGMGYVQRGGPVAPGVFTVKAFKEKPDAATAKQYVAGGDYYWNSGMFVWRTATILNELARHLPATHAAARELAKTWYTPAGAGKARDIYPTLQKISIDFAVMEKATSVLVVEMDLDWLDVGSWTALPTVLGADQQGNTKAAERVAIVDGKGNIMVSEDEHLIAAIGVENLVIIHSPDATLVCHRDQVQRIKEMVAALEREHGGTYS